MKILALAAFVFLGFSVAQADQVSPSAVYLRSTNIQACNFWTNHSHQGASSGYICSGFPRSVEVVDSFHLEQVLAAMDSKIRELENRVAELEKKP